MTAERHPEARRALVAGARLVAERGLVVGSAGNVSVRVGDEMLITPRRARLEAIDPAACVQVRLADGVVANPREGVQPSSETPLHRAVYDATDAGAVVHTHSQFATVLSTLVDEMPAVHYAMTAFGGRVRVVPYATFGTDELAASVAVALDGRRAALLANHGAVVIADSVETAVDLAVQLEWLASVCYYATLAGNAKLLDDAELERVVEQARTLRYEAARLA
jgi:L-fuculose-phosphate aldolase